MAEKRKRTSSTSSSSLAAATFHSIEHLSAFNVAQTMAAAPLLPWPHIFLPPWGTAFALAHPAALRYALPG